MRIPEINALKVKLKGLVHTFSFSMLIGQNVELIR